MAVYMNMFLKSGNFFRNILRRCREPRTIGEILCRAARKYHRKEALRSEEKSLHYTEMKDRAEILAGAFREMGIRFGDRVAVLLPNGRDAVLTFLACGMMGAVFVPLDIFYRRPELKKIIKNLHVSLLIADDSFFPLAVSLYETCPKLKNLVLTQAENADIPSFEKLLQFRKKTDGFPKIRPRTPLLHLFTSGSTGMPKSVLLSHANVIARGREYWRRFPLSANETCYNLAPLFRGAALFSVIIPGICCGIRTVLPASFRPALVWQEMKAENATIFHANPFHFAVLANLSDLEKAPPGLKLCFSSGNRLPAKVAEKCYQRFGIFIEERYGTVEAGGICVNGFPRKGVRIRLTDERGKRIRAADQPGEIRIRTPMMVKEYYQSPHISRSIFRGGWFCSGDVGMRDSLGRIRILYRKKTVIRIEGRDVYPDAVESILRSHPNVKTAMVVRDSRESEKLKAYVSLEKQGSAADILAFCKTRMDAREIPQIEIRDELPRSWKAVAEGAEQSYPVWGKF